jgi:hypothetical protein
MPKIILFNGPPGSGKDYATKIIMQELAVDEPVHMKLSKPLKDLVMDHFNLTAEQLEGTKDDAATASMHSSLRDYQIALFESIAKILGRQWLSTSLVNRAKRFDNNVIIVSDCGREEEIGPIIKNFGARNVMLIQLHRQGTTFKHDIRQYIDDPRIYSCFIKNDGTINFKLEVLNEVYAFLAGDV